MTDWNDIEAAAQQLAGNHRHFDSFAWFDRPDDSDNWTVVYTCNRDSSLLEQSNAEAIAAELQCFIDSGDVVAEHHGHFAVGWIDGFAIRVFNAAGQVTEAFRVWCRLQERLSDYPVLDEEDFSRREYKAAVTAIEQEGSSLVQDEAPEDWAEQVFSWLSHNDPRQLENRDGTGAYPSKESIEEALTDLELLDPELLPDPDEPQEGDFVTEDFVYWHEQGTGKLLLVTADPKDPFSAADNWSELLRMHMKSERFYPAVWSISDHGNAHPIDLDR